VKEDVFVNDLKLKIKNLKLLRGDSRRSIE